jgi:hypothetical protein
MAIQTFTAGQVLTAAQLNTVAKGTDVPSCGIRRVAALTVGGNVAVTFDTEDWDTDTMFSPSSSTVTIKTAGVYMVQVRTDMSGTSTNQVPNLVISGTGDQLSQDFGPYRFIYTTVNKYAANATIQYRAFFLGGTYTATNTSMIVQYLSAP